MKTEVFKLFILGIVVQAHRSQIARCVEYTTIGSSQVCQTCESGYAPSFLKTECKQCLSPCKECTSVLDYCKACNVGYFINTSSDASGAISTCVACTSNCQSCNSTTVCDFCLPKFFKDTSSKCQSCSSNCLACSSPEVCTSCEEGFQVGDANEKKVCLKKSMSTWLLIGLIGGGLSLLLIGGVCYLIMTKKPPKRGDDYVSQDGSRII